MNSRRSALWVNWSLVALIGGLAALSIGCAAGGSARKIGPDSAADEKAATPVDAEILPSPCQEEGEELAAAFIGPHGLVDPDNAAFTQRLAEWNQLCATPPHGVLLLAAAAFTSRRIERATGLLYDAMAYLDATPSAPELPYARALTALIAEGLSLPLPVVADRALRACRHGVGPLCPSAARAAWRSGRDPEQWRDVLDHCQDAPCRRLCAEVLTQAFIARKRYAAARRTVAREPAAGLDPGVAPVEGGGMTALVAVLEAHNDGDDAPGAAENDPVRETCRTRCRDDNDGYCCAAFAVGVARTAADDRADDGIAAARKSCVLGVGLGCLLAGVHDLGSGDSDHGWELLDTGCELEEPRACLELGNRLFALAETRRALPYLEKGCILGSGDSCLAHAAAADTLGDDSARSLLVTACMRGGVAAACLDLARRLRDSGDPKAALTHAEDACRLDEGAGCRMAGELLSAPPASPPANHAPSNSPADSVRDTPDACAAFLRGCALGDGPSCRRTALECPEGQDPVRRSELLTAACRRHDPEACRRNAGVADTADPAAALEKPCALGDDPSCRSLERYRPLTPDTARAACAAHSPVGCARWAAILTDDPRQRDETITRDAAKAACGADIAPACLLLADWYIRQEDAASAAKALLDCCRRSGDGLCCARHGCDLAERGNLPAAIPLLSRVCGPDNPAACRCLGLSLWRHGQTAQSAQALRIACSSFDDETCDLLVLAVADADADEALTVSERRCRNGGDARVCLTRGRILAARQLPAEALIALRMVAGVLPQAALLAGKASLSLGLKDEAETYFGMACVAGLVEGCRNAAALTPSLPWWDRACELGDARGCLEAARLYESEGRQDVADSYRQIACGLDPLVCAAPATPAVTTPPTPQRK